MEVEWSLHGSPLPPATVLRWKPSKRLESANSRWRRSRERLSMLLAKCPRKRRLLEKENGESRNSKLKKRRILEKRPGKNNEKKKKKKMAHTLLISKHTIRQPSITCSLNSFAIHNKIVMIQVCCTRQITMTKSTVMLCSSLDCQCSRTLWKLLASSFLSFCQLPTNAPTAY